MAQTNFTPISLYYSATASNTPTAGNLVAGELAINTADGKLFYKDSSGVVQVIAGKGGAGVAGGSTTQVQYNSSGSLAGSANFTWDNTNTRLGVGTASPAYSLDVAISQNSDTSTRIYNANAGSSARATIVFGNNSNSGAAGILYNSSTNTAMGGGNSLNIYNGLSAPITFQTNGTEQMRIDSSGNVGIGTSTINAKFQLQVGDVMPSASGNMATGAVIQTGSGAQALNIGTTATNSYAWLNSAYANSSNSAIPMVFMTGATERMRINSNGDLFTGLTARPSGANTGSSGAIAALGPIMSSQGYNTHAGAGGAFTGNLFNIQWTGSPILWIDTTNIGTITVVSDYRIKRNIETQTAPALERVMALRPVTYQMADYGTLFKSSENIKEGFIAHEVQEVIPSGAEGEKDAENQIQSLRVDAILAVAVKAIQEQQAIIETLTKRLTTLENK